MLSILLIGVGLSMDAFAVSVTSGLTVKGCGPKQACLLGAYFGGFQCLMPLLGYLLGSTVSGLPARSIVKLLYMFRILLSIIPF